MNKMSVCKLLHQNLTLLNTLTIGRCVYMYKMTIIIYNVFNVTSCIGSLVKQKLSVNQHPFDAMANSVAQAVINIQEEIKRDIEKEKEIKEDRKSVLIGHTLEKVKFLR